MSTTTRLRDWVWAPALIFAGIIGPGLAAAPAEASPGQCTTVWGNGFCDSYPDPTSGVYRHCEYGFGIANCFLVRPVPVEVDPRGWQPA